MQNIAHKKMLRIITAYFKNIKASSKVSPKSLPLVSGKKKANSDAATPNEP